MLQLGHLRDIGHIGGSAMNMMNQPRLGIGADMLLHSEEVLVTFLRLMHLGITLSLLALGQAGGMNDGGIDDGALAQGQAFFLQITVDYREDRRGQLMLFQQVPEVHDHGVFKGRGAQGQARELADGRDFVERFFHGRVTQGEPVLQQMNPQHGFKGIRFSAAAGFGVERLDQAQQTCPGARLDPFRRGSVRGVSACACRHIRNRKSSSGSWAARIR